MIRNREDLRFNIKEDMSQYSLSFWKYIAYLIYGFENAYIEIFKAFEIL